MEKLKWIRAAVFGVLIITGMIFSCGDKLLRDQRFYNSQFSGVVISQRLESRTNFVYVNLRGEERALCLYGYLNKVTYSISPGDSIFKYPRTTNIFIKRDGEVLNVSSPKNSELLLIWRDH